jgi:hypothetical protein
MAFGLALFAARVEATTVDLTTADASGSLDGATGGTAQFIQGEVNAGTGVFPSFVQITGSGGGTVKEAYNTTANNTLNNGSSATFNHEITVADLELVTVDGVDYYQFLLDINENSGNGNEFLSLDDVVIVISDTANQSVQGIPSGTTVWDMNNPTDVVLMDYSLEPGSGDGDMTLLIPVADFTAAGADAEDFVYLYSKFGSVGVVGTGKNAKDFGVSDGFEEWALRTTPTDIPDTPDGGATALMLGMAMLGLGVVARRTKALL